ARQRESKMLSTWVANLHPIERDALVEFSGQRHPSLSAGVFHRLEPAVLLSERAIALSQPTRARIRRLDRVMRVVEQHALDFPDVGVREAPVVAAHLFRDVDDGVAG